MKRVILADNLPASLQGDALADRADIALANHELDRALQLYDEAEPSVGHPDRCAGGRWMVHMLRGDFQAAWRESDAIRFRGAPDPHRFWQGESIQGKRLILRSLHGFGDAVQMFRFLPRLRAKASSLVVEVPPKLIELAPCFEGMGQVITWGDDAPSEPPLWDVQVEVMELPYMLRVASQQLAPASGYLHLPATVQQQVREKLGVKGTPRVGLAWAAGEWNPARSIPFEEVKPLLEMDGIEFWNLQGTAKPRNPGSVETSAAFRDVYECGDGILPLAAVIEQLDLVLSADTLSAHLAGALGVPCWLLLQHRADWRWMAAGERTPWYPSLRLWRQESGEGWSELLRRVEQALAAWALGFDKF